ncbi:MAG: peptide MFS transporter [Acidobacteria bacterium]|nr:peptide MFS transporter [Acidobacteriota bacterium]MCI0719625.1 peptide MFS transporter [Acidobacteriota bacterium]
MIAAQKTDGAVQEKHPKGLYVLFATEMWERFGFYTLGGMLALYLRDSAQGMGWSEEEATTLFSYYLMFVYASPLIGGWLADKWMGYRMAITVGALFFGVGYFLLYVPSVSALYVALTLVIIGNGFFKPNVSAMVGNLYPEGSKLKDSAYNIFYMGINIGAFLGPVVAEFMQRRFGFRLAFTIAGFGMIICLAIFWAFRKHLSGRDKGDATPRGQDRPRSSLPIDSVPDSKRVMALVVIFVIVIVFWMAFHQNQLTLTYFANDNTDWSAWGNVSGVISNAINPFWIITLTVPLIAFWRWLARKGLEPSTPAKIAIGMFLTAVSFYLMSIAGWVGGNTGRVSPWWLISAYAIVSLGELMLSPMGLSLVSKVAPAHMRGLMMGGWFVATAIGNKLTAIGVYWREWDHSTFFFILATMALFMSGVLWMLLKPLKKAMPGV